MASPFDFDFEIIRNFIVSRGGRVTNHELVKHFKASLTHPERRDEARNHFKEIVNTLATITRNEEGEKYLVLKKKYRSQFYDEGSSSRSCASPSNSFTWVNPSGYQESLSPGPVDPSASLVFSPPTKVVPPSFRPPPPPSVSGGESSDNDSVFYDAPGTPSSFVYHHQPPAFPFPAKHSPPPPPPAHKSHSSRQHRRSQEQQQPPANHQVDHSPQESPVDSLKESTPPPVPPRRKSSSSLDKLQLKEANKENEEAPRRPKPICEDPDIAEGLVEDSKISVKECMQKFNRLAASGGPVLYSKSLLPNKKRNDKGDDDDTVSVATLDQKAREWLVRCAQANYQAIAKLASENPKLVKLKDPTNGYTALHWGAKHGNENIIKLIAGTYGGNVNARTNGGYTALHIAMQFGHEEIYNLLVQVYGADGNLRDWSGKKARQYLANKDTSVSADTFRKIKARKKQAAERDLGFLRIGSLNVRVKRTTEAFSNFLGVGNTDKLHKHWGSADNIPSSDSKKMPPPKFAPIKKRKSKRGADFVSMKSSTSNGINYNPDGNPNAPDSDSDSAAGFGSNWQSTV